MTAEASNPIIGRYVQLPDRFRAQVLCAICVFVASSAGIELQHARSGEGSASAPISVNPLAARKKAAIPAKIERYAERVIARYDTDENGQLTAAEWQPMQGSPQQIDADRNGVITSGEYATHVARFSNRRHIRLLFPETTESEEEPPLLQPKSAPPKPSPKPSAVAAVAPTASQPATPAGEAAASADESPAAEPMPPPAKAAPRRRDAKFFVPASRMPTGLPAWFHTQDKDGDGQITLAEYGTDTPSGLGQFQRYDRNGDGVVTASEVLPPKKAPVAEKKAPTVEKKAPAPEKIEQPEPDKQEGPPREGSYRRRRS